MDRKATARETLDIMEQGYYEIEGRKIEIRELQEHSVKESFLLTPKQGELLLENCKMKDNNAAGKLLSEHTCVWNCSSVDAILKLASEGNDRRNNKRNDGIAVLNFASAKNPGGGFLNGAMAQEESLAASSCLYKTLTAHKEYYEKNRVCNTMMYTDHAIYSPDVVFFRDGRFHLLKEPVIASVLTLPAVNMGQVLLKGEDVKEAEQVMKRRMKLSLAIFAEQQCKHLILGAYGCGVFRNDPNKIAAWYKELLEEFFLDKFESIIFAVMDRSSSQDCIRAFQNIY